MLCCYSMPSLPRGLQNITYNQDNISILNIFVIHVCHTILLRMFHLLLTPPPIIYIYLHTSFNIPCINANAEIFFIFYNHTRWLMFRASATYPYIFIARVATFPSLSDTMLCSYSYCISASADVGNGMYFTEHKQRALM